MHVRIVWLDPTGRELFTAATWTVPAEAMGAVLGGLRLLGVSVDAETDADGLITVTCRETERVQDPKPA
jgi:hypothetical protein